MFTLKANGYKTLSIVIRQFLDEVHETMDTEAAFSLMILAQTFSLETKEGQKETEFIFNSISDHKIWGSLELWERGINDSIKEEIDKNAINNANESLEEKKLRQDNIKFGKIGCFVVSMLALKINQSEVKLVIDKICASQNLPVDMAKTLQVYNSHRIAFNNQKKVELKC